MPNYTPADSSSPIITARVAGEKQDRFQLLADGTILKGAGTTGPVVVGTDQFAGVVAPTGVSYTGVATALTASRAYIARFVPTRNLTVTKIAFVTTTAAGADDECDVGIYDSALTRLVSAGATTGKLNATAGVQTVTVSSTALQAGTVYYAAFSSGTQGGSAGQVLMTSFGDDKFPSIFGTAAGSVITDYKAASHALPATLAVTGGLGKVPILALRES